MGLSTHARARSVHNGSGNRSRDAKAYMMGYVILWPETDVRFVFNSRSSSLTHIHTHTLTYPMYTQLWSIFFSNIIITYTLEACSYKCTYIDMCVNEYLNTIGVVRQKKKKKRKCHPMTTMNVFFFFFWFCARVQRTYELLQFVRRRRLKQWKQYCIRYILVVSFFYI